MDEMEHRSGVRKPSVEKNSGFAAWQLRAARAAADISIQKLADLSAVSVSSIRRAEQNGSAPMSRVNCKALTDALGSLGVTMSGPDITPAVVTVSASAQAAMEADALAPASSAQSAKKAQSKRPLSLRDPRP